MLLNLLYLGLNVAALGVLMRAKYYRMWGLLVAQLAVTCWQIGAITAIGSTDRTTAIRWWFPGDLLLVVLTAGAVLEVLWRSMRGFPNAHKWGVCAWITISFVFAGMCIRWVLALPVNPDWFEQVKSDRIVWHLCIATAALIAAGIAHTFNRHNDPRFVRFHASIVAVLAIGHVVLSDVSRWSESRMAYRCLEILCCAGWCINASLSGKEALWVAKVECGPLAPAAPMLSPQASEASPQPVRGGFGGRRWAEEAAVLRRGTPVQTSPL